MTSKSVSTEERILTLESLVGYFAIFLGYFGLAACLGGIAQKQHITGHASSLALVVVLTPLLLLYTATFFKVQIPFLPVRLVWTFAIVWWGVLAIAVEVLRIRGWMPPDSPKEAMNIARITMHIGWLGVVFPIHLYFLNLRQRKTGGEISTSGS